MLLFSFALAGSVEVWSLQEGEFGEDYTPFLDNAPDWSGGYPADTWWVTVYGELINLTDDNVGEDFAGYGQQSAADNWVISGPPLRDVQVEVELFNDDDDTLGLVSHHDGVDSFYLLFTSSNSSPPPVGVVDGPTLVLLRVQGGQAEELGRAGLDGWDGDDGVLELQVDDGVLRASFDGELRLEVSDPEPLEAGAQGFYSYDCGYNGGQDYGGFTAIFVRAMDADEDGVPDDSDNCLEEANPYQQDEDEDGLGDACDDAVERGVLDLQPTRACSTGGPGGTAGGLLGLLLVLAHRRRR